MTNKEAYNLQSIAVIYQQLLVPYSYNYFNLLQLFAFGLYPFLKQFYFNIFSTLARKIVSKYSLKPDIVKLLINSVVRSPVGHPPQNLYIFCLTAKWVKWGKCLIQCTISMFSIWYNIVYCHSIICSLQVSLILSQRLFCGTASGFFKYFSLKDVYRYSS